MTSQNPEQELDCEDLQCEYGNVQRVGACTCSCQDGWHGRYCESTSQSTKMADFYNFFTFLISSPLLGRIDETLSGVVMTLNSTVPDVSNYHPFFELRNVMVLLTSLCFNWSGRGFGRVWGRLLCLQFEVIVRKTLRSVVRGRSERKTYFRVKL